MYPEGIFNLIKLVVTSWQVIFITVAIVLYLNIVFYVSRYYRTPKISSITGKLNFKRKKSEEVPAASGPEEVASSNDELGLEE